MNVIVKHLGDRFTRAGYARSNALRGVFTSARCAVAPIPAPTTGEVRPQAGIDVLMATGTVDRTKGGVGLRSLEPPI